MEELQEKLNGLTRNEEARYFYHFTGFSADTIMEDGLLVASNRWDESFLEFTKSELANIEQVINDNRSTKLKDNAYMIIAGVYADNMNHFIRKLNEEEFAGINYEGVGSPDYIVDSNNLLGYIDLDTYEFIVNEFADVIEDDLYL